MNDNVKNICKIGQGHDCCRYLTMGPEGFCCEKKGSLKKLLDERVELKTINARGDNCEGKNDSELR